MPDAQNEKPFDLAGLRRLLASGRDKEAWRSLNELAENEQFQAFARGEFPHPESLAKDLSRRDFLKLLAAPLALAGLSACVPQPREHILPYVEAPEGVTPGRPLFFATAFELEGYAQGLLVESHEGRPIKVEGNPQHPASLGAADVFAQASILNLYDPDRAQVVSSRGEIRTWDNFQTALTRALESQRGSGGAGLRLLTGTVTSPTLARQIQTLLEQFPQARWHQYEPAGRDAARLGAQAAFGQPVETLYRFDRANVILSLDNNFVYREPGRLRYLRDFGARRQVQEGSTEMSRLYVVESSLTTLGGFADHRLPLQAGQIEGYARALASQLGLEVPPGPELQGVPQSWIEAVAADLQANQGASLILAGHQQPPAVHALVHAMNAALGNSGQTVIYLEPVEANPVDQGASLRELAGDLEAGRVEVLVTLEGNPVFSAPADLNFAEQYQKAAFTVYHGLYEDETAALSHWHIPALHPLESWGDTRAFDGTTSIVQPLIEPLYGGRSAYELLALLLGEFGQNSYEIVRGYWQERLFPQGQEGGAAATPGAGQTGGPPATGEAPSTEASSTEAPAAEGTPAPGGAQGAGGTDEAGAPAAGGEAAASEFERFWRRALELGFIPGTGAPEAQVSPAPDLLANLPPTPQGGSQDGSANLEIVFEPDASLWDGRFANNAWLQELPHPVTKLSWDNAALISPGTAERLGLENEEVVELVFDGRSLRAPVWILPGQPDNSVTVSLGYGRQRGGQVLEGAGFNAYRLRTSAFPWFSYGLEIRKTGERYRLVSTQDHFSMEGRDLVKAASLEQFVENPGFVHESAHGPETEDGHPPSLYPEWEYEGNAWGMAINLGSCIGCNACVLACQAENNIPVVGKDQVANGREMYWLHLDAYYQGGLENPEVLFQPRLCMHCEKAPCEPVCPVEATVHSSEGLNEMVYNRCVGTRYCSNNCPYKVRRFNFLQYAEQDLIPLKMLHNPDVSVRTRGVMEKCTYCVQRINAARIDAKTANRPIRDGEIVTACQQACPTQAIVFGNINDPNSQVRQLKDQPQNYALLEELGTQPRTTYLAKIKNPNPALQDGRE